MSVIGLTVRCVQNSSLELQKISSLKNFLLPCFNQCHPNFSSVFSDGTKKCSHVIWHGRMGNRSYTTESRKLINNLIGYNRAGNNNVFGLCKSNPSSDVKSLRTCVTLVTNKSVEMNCKSSTFVNGQSLQPTIWSKNPTCLQPQRLLSEKCTAKSKDNAEKVTQEEQLSLTNKDRFKKAMKDYGSVVIVFHLTLSWGSLAFLYLLISNGVDVMNLLNKLPYLGEQLNNNSLAAGASTFVIAYAIYKAVAPIRMSITIASCPFLVRFLRGKGLLKR